MAKVNLPRKLSLVLGQLGRRNKTFLLPEGGDESGEVWVKRKDPRFCARHGGVRLGRCLRLLHFVWFCAITAFRPGGHTNDDQKIPNTTHKNNAGSDVLFHWHWSAPIPQTVMLLV